MQDNARLQRRARSGADYLLFVAYGLLAIGVIGCLAFIANSFEDEDSKPERVNHGR
jgi:hypothetical protein